MQVEGKVVLRGQVEGYAMVTDQPMNFLAAYSRNLALPWKTGKISDAEHELHGNVHIIHLGRLGLRKDQRITCLLEGREMRLAYITLVLATMTLIWGGS
ncbi:MAG: hypothetical protein HXS52_10200 [Theionarchaea archaeon]|nr:hypothetical protein [Theionarchaea archaeon]